MSGTERVIFADSIRSPEELFTQPFRMSSIVGEGSGRGFNFKDLNLPQGWQNVTSDLKSLDWELFYRTFSRMCEDLGLNPGRLEVDSTTGLLTSLAVENDSHGEVSLNLSSHSAEYSSSVPDLRSAVALHGAAASYLTTISCTVGADHRYPYIERFGQGFTSHFLLLPEGLEKVEKPITQEYYQMRFAQKAHNIAGRFGLTLGPGVRFNEMGILDLIQVTEGSACSYQLDMRGMYKGYVPHNVDNLYQAAALHGIAAEFLNDILNRTSE